MKSLTGLFCALPFLTFVLSTAGCSSKSSDEKTDLGVTTAGAYTARVYLEGSAIAAGKPSRIVMVVTGGMPTGITGWIGTEKGEGSTKKAAEFDAADGDFDIDLVSPSPLPAGSKFWVETDTAGKKDIGSIAYSK